MVTLITMMVTKGTLKKEEGIKTTRLVLTLSTQIFEKLKRKAIKNGCTSVQQYVYEVLRRDVFRKKVGGRPNEILKAANVLSMKHPLSTKGKPFKI